MIWCKIQVKAGKIKEKKIVILLLCIQALGIMITSSDLLENKSGASSEIVRPEPGEGEAEVELEVDTKGYKGPVNLVVEDRAYTSKEIDKLFQQAIKEIDESFLGENESLESIKKPVIMRQKYCNDAVSASWQVGDGLVVLSDGSIDYDKVKSPLIQDVNVILKCEKQDMSYGFQIRVLPADTSSREGIEAYVNKLVKDNEKEGRIKLPKKIYDEAVEWKVVSSKDGVALCIVGLVALGMIPYLEKINEKKEEKERQERIEYDYPKLVSKLSILIGVGLSIQEAIVRVGKSYEPNYVSGRDGKALVVECSREIGDGMSIALALEHLGKKSGSKAYRKLTLLLSQNIKQGNEKIVEALDKEDMEVIELQRNIARRKGEEATTKLLFPMMGMLVVVLVILILPAILQVKIM